MIKIKVIYNTYIHSVKPIATVYQTSMETKKIIGIIILVLNISGLGFLFYLGGLRLLDHFFPKEEDEQTPAVGASGADASKGPTISDDMLPKDDLLKDMDLSDLDNLNLDDFE